MCAQQDSWSQQKLEANVGQHAAFLPQQPHVVTKQRCSNEAVVHDAMHFVSAFERGLAYGRQHSTPGQDCFVKGETFLTQALIWAGTQPAAPAGLQVLADGIMQRAVQAQRLGYNWRWDTIYMNVGAYFVLVCVPV